MFQTIRCIRLRARGLSLSLSLSLDGSKTRHDDPFWRKFKTCGVPPFDVDSASMKKTRESRYGVRVGKEGEKKKAALPRNRHHARLAVSKRVKSTKEMCAFSPFFFVFSFFFFGFHHTCVCTGRAREKKKESEQERARTSRRESGFLSKTPPTATTRQRARPPK